MDLVTLLIVGLIAGLLARFAVGGLGYGLLGDLVVGVAGAFIGSWLFQALRIRNPVSGIAGTILVAFIGSVLLLLIVRAVRRPRRVL